MRMTFSPQHTHNSRSSAFYFRSCGENVIARAILKLAAAEIFIILSVDYYRDHI